MYSEHCSPYSANATCMKTSLLSCSRSLCLWWNNAQPLRLHSHYIALHCRCNQQCTLYSALSFTILQSTVHTEQCAVLSIYWNLFCTLYSALRFTVLQLTVHTEQCAALSIYCNQHCTVHSALCFSLLHYPFSFLLNGFWISIYQLFDSSILLNRLMDYKPVQTKVFFFFPPDIIWTGVTFVHD